MIRNEKKEDIHINFRNKEEIEILIDALEDKWIQGKLTMKGIALIIILERAIGKQETTKYIKENGISDYIESLIND